MAKATWLPAGALAETRPRLRRYLSHIAGCTANINVPPVLRLLPCGECGERSYEARVLLLPTFLLLSYSPRFGIGLLIVGQEVDLTANHVCIVKSLQKQVIFLTTIM